MVKILKLKFRRDLEAELWSVFCLVEVTKWNLGQDSEARFGQDFSTENCSGTFFVQLLSYFAIFILIASCLLLVVPIISLFFFERNLKLVI